MMKDKIKKITIITFTFLVLQACSGDDQSENNESRLIPAVEVDAGSIWRLTAGRTPERYRAGIESG
jgi:hypothetical protein